MADNPAKISGKHRLGWILILLLIIGSLAGTVVFYSHTEMSYKMYTSDTITYPQARVTRILSEELSDAETGDDRQLGIQYLEVKILDGKQKGDTVQIENYLSTTHNIPVREGTKIILKADQPENAEPYYSVYNYSRSGGYLAMLVIFAAIVLLVGRMKGLRSLFSLGYILALVMGFLIPAIYTGWDPIGSTLLVAALSITVSMVLLNGLSVKTLIACVSTVLGIFLSAILFYLVQKIVSISGYNLSEAEELLLISQSTGLKIRSLLFAGTMISCLGALIDMSMSVVSPLWEIKEQHPETGPAEIYRSGIRIGQDLIGTMCSTLLLAFAGTAIVTLLVVISYGTAANQILHSDYMAIEIAQGLTGSMAVVLAIPLSAGFSALGSRYLTAGK